MPQTLQKLTYGLVRLCVADDGMVLQRFLLWERRNNTVMPFKETVQQVWARISALRDSLDGPQVRHSTRWPSTKLHMCVSHSWPKYPGGCSGLDLALQSVAVRLTLAWLRQDLELLGVIDNCKAHACVYSVVACARSVKP